jgi:hypothetical protein
MNAAVDKQNSSERGTKIRPLTESEFLVALGLIVGTDALENAPGGVHIVLKGTAPNGIDLVTISYRYSTKTTLFFVATADAGSTTPGKPYEMKYTDDHGNVCVHLMEHSDIVSKFFLDSYTIDKHTQSRQYDLALEKTWLTQDPYFHLATTLLGIITVNTWKLAD